MFPEVILFLFRRFVEILEGFHFRPHLRRTSPFPFELVEYNGRISHSPVYTAVLQENEVIADLHGILMAGIVDTAFELGSHRLSLNPIGVGIDDGKEEGQKTYDVDLLWIVNNPDGILSNFSEEDIECNCQKPTEEK